MAITEDEPIRQLSWSAGGEKWDDTWSSIKNLLATDVLQYSGVHIFFLPAVNELNKDHELCQKLSQKLHIDPFFWTNTAYESNGFFMSEDKPINSQDFGGYSYCSISRFLIKELEKKGHSYNWQYISFFSLWIAGNKCTQVLLCFDLTDIMTTEISRGFLDFHGESLNKSPFEVFAVLAKAITERFDFALWGFRKPVRDIEKNRTRLNKYYPSHPVHRFGVLADKYEEMYELSRHIIHAREVLKVTVDTFKTIEDLQSHYEQQMSSNSVEVVEPLVHTRKPVKVFHFYSSFIENLERRAESFERRLQNEIQLVYHLIAAEEASISRSSLNDSRNLLNGTKNILTEMRDQTSKSQEILNDIKEETSKTTDILDEMKGEVLIILKDRREKTSSSNLRSQEIKRDWKNFITLIALLSLFFVLGILTAGFFGMVSSGPDAEGGNIGTHDTTPPMPRSSSWLQSLLQSRQ